MKNKKLLKLVLNAVAFAMGVASIVLLIMKQAQEEIIPLLAIGLFCLAFLNITDIKKS